MEETTLIPCNNCQGGGCPVCFDGRQHGERKHNTSFHFEKLPNGIFNTEQEAQEYIKQLKEQYSNDVNCVQAYHVCPFILKKE